MTVPTTTRACEVMNLANVGNPPLSDDDLIADTPFGQIPLSSCVISAADGEVTYTHQASGNRLFVIGEPEATAWPGRGYRVGDFVLRPVYDTITKPTGVRLSAMPNALAPKRT